MRQITWIGVQDKHLSANKLQNIMCNMSVFLKNTCTKKKNLEE